MQMLRRCLLRCQGVFRLHYGSTAWLCLICLFLVGVLEYMHGAHGCDLHYWRQLLARVEDKPITLLLLIGSGKLLAILVMTLWSYTRVRSAHIEPPIQHVKRRYRRFIAMRLLAALEQLVELLEQGDSEPRSARRCCQFRRCHAALVDAVELFRSDARRLFERTDEQLCLPLEQVLRVDGQIERELLHRGYGARVFHLKELDIYNMVFDQDSFGLRSIT